MPVSLIAFFVLWHVTNDAEKNARETLQNYVELASTKLSDELHSSLREVALYAQTDAVKSMSPDLFLPFFARELERQQGHYEKLFISDLDGHFYTNFCGNPARGLKCTFDDTDVNSLPKHLKGREYWQKVVGTNWLNKLITYLSDPVVSYTTGVKQLIVASTVFNYQNQLSGMMGVSIEWKRIEALLTQLKTSIFAQYHWEPKLMLISASGTYWYHWEDDKLVHLKRDENGNIIKDKDGLPISISSNIYQEQEVALHQAHGRMLKSQSGYIEYDAAETSDVNFIFFAPIELTQYSLALIVSERHVNEASYNLKKLYLGILVVALLVFVSAAILIAKAITDPIVRLVGQANRLKEGHYTFDKTSSGTDELSELSRTFSQMATVIVDRQKRLEQSEERFNLAMKGANDGLWDWQLNNNQVYYSPRWKNMLGYGEGELGGSSRTYFNLLDTKDYKRIKKELGKIHNSSQDSFNEKIRMKHKDGHYVHILTRGIVVRDNKGAVTRFVGTHVDITEQMESEEKIKKLNEDLEKTVKERTLRLEVANRHLKELAMMDMMLNIGNRRALDKQLNEFHQSFMAKQEGYSLLLFDVDFFKKYNDLYGHQKGDETLIQVVACIKAYLKKSEQLFRNGGEEFICILPNTALDTAFKFAQKMVFEVEKLKISHDDSSYKFVTVSVGCADVLVSDRTWEQVISRSDKALYRAKANGRHQAALYQLKS